MSLHTAGVKYIQGRHPISQKVLSERDKQGEVRLSRDEDSNQTWVLFPSLWDLAPVSGGK